MRFFLQRVRFFTFHHQTSERLNSRPTLFLSVFGVLVFGLSEFGWFFVFIGIFFLCVGGLLSCDGFIVE